MSLGDIKMSSVLVTQKLCCHAVDLVHRQCIRCSKEVSPSKTILMDGNIDSLFSMSA